MSSSQPISADVVLRKLQSGEKLDDLCSLCASPSTLIKLDDTNYVHLSDEYNDARMTLSQLVKLLDFNHLIGNAKSPMICEVCINNLCNFQLFKTKCKKIQSGLEKLTTLIQEDRLEKVINVVTMQPAVVLPYKNIHDYENATLEVRTNDDKASSIVRKQSSQYVCSVCNETLKKGDIEKHIMLHYYKVVTQNMVAGKSYCVCCLGEEGLITTELNEVDSQGDMVLSDIFYDVFGHDDVNDLGEIELCGECFESIVQMYNFKKMFLASTTVIRDCVFSMEVCTASPKTAVTILEDGTDHAICLLDFYNTTINLLTPARINSIQVFLKPLRQKVQKAVIKLKPFFKNQRLSYQKIVPNCETFKPISSRKSVTSVADDDQIRVLKRDSDVELIVWCHICSKEFNGVDNLQRHRNLDHSDVAFCPYCDKHYNDPRKALLNAHMRICVNIPKRFACDLCRARFNTKQKLIGHRFRHFPPSYECTLCSKKYWTETDLKNHQHVTHKDVFLVKFECSICPMDFNTKAEMIQHLDTHDKSGLHTCRFCSNTFALIANSLSHKCPEKNRLKNRTRKLNANVIKQVAETKETDQNKIINFSMCDTKKLKLLKKKPIALLDNSTTRNVKKFSCNHCSYETNFEKCLEAHVNRLHTKMRPYWCKTCNKSFLSKSSLTDHMKTHDSAEKFGCSICRKQFLSMKALAFHSKSHTGDKPYSCDICNEVFVSLSRRQEHKRKAHSDPTIKCDLCPRMFFSARQLAVHRNNFHSEEKNESDLKIAIEINDEVIQ